MADVLDLVFTRAEAPALPILDAWRELPDRPLAPYESEVEAFVYDGGLVRVSPEAYRVAQSAGESFAIASVCPGCGEAEDEGVFFWTLDRDARVRVCLLIENEVGRWTCVLHPFDFEKAAVTT